MAEYVTKEQVIDWYRPYGQTDEPIPFETLVSDLKDMKAADVSPVMHGRWLHHTMIGGHIHAECSECHKVRIIDNYCPNCGCRMDGGIE